MTYVLASANKGKIAEMREILSNNNIDIVSRDELCIGIEVEETGSTFLENAALKATAICKASGMPAIADDSGLIVDALGGEPGLHTSSYGGKDLTPSQQCEYLLNCMKNMEHRAAKFVCTIVCMYPGGKTVAATGECCGTIATGMYGNDGFGFDPVFIPDGETRTLAQMTAQEKNAVSHRGKALREFVRLLSDYGDNDENRRIWRCV